MLASSLNNLASADSITEQIRSKTNNSKQRDKIRAVVIPLDSQRSDHAEIIVTKVAVNKMSQSTSQKKGHSPKNLAANGPTLSS